MLIDISVVIPCFNASKTIAETLFSALAQHPAEVIAVDDGSTDNTREILLKYSKDIKLLSQSNQGVSAARNAGIEASSAQWLVFLDSDDLFLHGALQRSLSLAQSSDSDLVVSDWKSSDFFCKEELPFAPSYHCADWHTLDSKGGEIACATSFWAPPAAILYKRNLVLKIGGFRSDLPIIQDARFLFDAAYQGARFAHLSTPGALYRISSRSLSRRDPAAFWLDCLRNGQQIEQLWLQRDCVLSPDQLDALQQIYAGAAQALIRAGHPGAVEAAQALQRSGGTLSRELSYGLQLLSLAGSTITRSAFTLGRSARALNRRLRQRHGGRQ